VYRAPWLAIFPGMMIFITVMTINFIGDGLRDAFDPYVVHEK
jgi:peptide/nickel transport system permease protein